jgi:hypothetical protein
MRAFADQGLSIREIARRLINTGTVPSVIGTATDVADQLEAWHRAGAADGFNLMFPVLPEDWLQFATLVVPELQRRGLAQTEDRGATLRDRLGLKKLIASVAADSSALRHLSRAPDRVCFCFDPGFRDGARRYMSRLCEHSVMAWPFAGDGDAPARG